MLRFCAPLTGMLQERTAFPSMITVHAPHWPRPQPKRGPCSSRSSRKTYNNGVVGSVSTTRDWLFTRSEIRAMRVSFLDGFDLGFPAKNCPLAYNFWRKSAGEILARAALNGYT